MLWRIPPDGERERTVELQTDMWGMENVGRKKAENVEISFDARPDHYQLVPAMRHETIIQDDNSFIIHIPELGPKELVAFGVLSHTTPPRPSGLRSSAGPGEFIAMGSPALPTSTAVRWIAYSLLFVGLVTSLYGAYRLVAWLVTLSPP